MRLQVELTCPVCQKNYFKAKSEYIRNEKLKRISFCSLHCSGKHYFEINIPKDKQSNYDISKHSANLIDEYTEFRYAFKSIKQRMHKGCKISLEDLKQIWESQKGICPYSGVKLKLMKHGYKFQDIANNRFEIASLDRIDSTKGYEKGNLVFVSTLINFMKNNCTVEQTVDFIFIMSEFLKTKTKQEIITNINLFIKQ